VAKGSSLVHAVHALDVVLSLPSRRKLHGNRRWLDGPTAAMYPIHMKRTNLVLDEKLLEEATRLSGERTYSRTVERALADYVRRIKAQRILELAGSGLWEGDLASMRRDRPARRPPARGSRVSR
jgi:Arc/MetJ family transcription regulator